MGRRELEWDKIDHVLRTTRKTLKELSEELGLAQSTIWKRMRKLRIKYKGARKKRQPDWEKIDRLLGRVEDVVVAMTFDMNPSAIFERRKKLGIDAYEDPRFDWERIDPFLERLSIPELAELLGVNESTIQKRRALLRG